MLPLVIGITHGKHELSTASTCKFETTDLRLNPKFKTQVNGMIRTILMI